ncbi:uncharacterized protein [Aegilops tauschii subsp. strangulata]|uniref:Uncharacterized protein n=2 Tax=Aegilops tauschii TaxID=37682 RepID=A0A453QXF9_AEGTS|nr:uncharacterized protein LOC109785561 [Aegilops tauschii subsp. strangulata]XP_020199737.1 uncharacterized protein LOC109785561 [Aegilops tauschii subsp. strangulata]XP_020199739.1 uncharacterized protein LOC109785561 [Aegilops tauschii subsp. strangulata]XP_045087765.1 uncharacterized protein LOC109785561 [Aegilops tauschii subsp. strangulata]XP_045087766.1 uncharacterized protein LOC109785561 [Aegilops tauschii subsp. strangulata]XP_045087767.1 uncharacterized protein LOC109785561 [Aegilop
MAIVLAVDSIITPASTLFSLIRYITTAVTKASECQDRCRDLDNRVCLLKKILSGLHSEAANDDATAWALSSLKEALLHALKLVQSCDRDQSGIIRQFLFICSAEEKHAMFDDVRKRIDSCQGDLLLALAARYCHLQAAIAPAKEIVHKHYYNIDSALFHVHVHPRGGAGAAASGPQVLPVMPLRPDERRRRLGEATLPRTETPRRPEERCRHGTTLPLQLLADSPWRPSHRLRSNAPAEASRERVAGPVPHCGNRVEPANVRPTRPSHRKPHKETTTVQAAPPSAPTPVVPDRGRAPGPRAAAADRLPRHNNRVTAVDANAIARAVANPHGDANH